MSNEQDPDRWARLRFAVIGPLLAAPPPRGELHSALTELSKRSWLHPVDGTAIKFAYSTIERWYHSARRAQDPVAALRRQRRTDAQVSRCLSPSLCQEIDALYQRHSGWSMQLHYDNLVALVKQHPELGTLPSYATVRRYFKAHGYHRKRRPKRQTPGALGAVVRLEQREVRSYEMDHVNALWHTDFHHGSKRVLLPDGRWITPLLLGVIDDHSRVICHLQWYSDETAQSFVHGLSQALQKRGLPRALMCDNGAAMKSEEFSAGLHTLGIVLDHTLPYSPYQNGKKETFWGNVEGRLLAMLEHVQDLTLEQLNRITQVWVEQEYHHKRHRDIDTTPIKRFVQSPNLSRPCPDSAALRRAFCRTVSRKTRRSDGTVALAGARYEIPNRYRHLERVRLSYAQWNLSEVELLDPNTPTPLCRLYPIDKSANAQGQRRSLEPLANGLVNSPATDSDTTLLNKADSQWPPLLRQMLADFAATGLPPAYLPQLSDVQTDNKEPSP